MNNFISQLSQAVRQNRPRNHWAVQIAIALGFVAIALSYSVYNSLNVTQAAESDWPKGWTQPPDYEKQGLLVDVRVADGRGNTTSFLVGDNLQIEWSLKTGLAYTNWSVDLYLLMAERDGVPLGEDNNNLNNVLYPIAYGVPAVNSQYSWKPIIDRFDPNKFDPTSLTSLPNPFDRHIFAVLVDDNIPIGRNKAMAWNVTPAFNIVPWRITQPASGNLSVGQTVTVKWDTNLTGNGRLYLEVENPSGGSTCQVIDGSSHCWIIKEFPRLEDRTITWKVGYSQLSPGGDWTKLNSGLFGVDITAHLYLVSFYYASPFPDHYYYGYDNDPNTADQQPAFEMVIVDRVEVTPATATVEAGVERQFTAKAYDSEGNEIPTDAADFVWVGTDATGKFNQTIADDYTVTATYGGKTAAATIKVIAGPIDDFAIAPTISGGDGEVDEDTQTITIDAGVDISFTASAQDAYSNPIVAEPIIWSITKDGVALDLDSVMNPAGTFNLTEAGTYIVTATFGGKSDSWTIIVDISEIIKVELSPAGNVFWPINYELEFVATASDQFDNAIDSVTYPNSFTWEGTLGLNDSTFKQTIVGEYQVRAGYLLPASTIYSAYTTVTVTEIAFGGIYRSRIIPIDAEHPNLGLANLETFQSHFSEPAGSDISFAIKFYGANDNPLGLSTSPDGDGEYHLNVGGDNIDLPVDYFDSYTWFSAIRKVQFIIEMSTEDYADATKRPWVASVQLDYAVVEEVVGAINFAAGEVASKALAAGGSVVFNLIATPIAGFNPPDQPVSIELGLDWGGSAPVGIAYVFDKPILYNFSSATPVSNYPFKITFTADNSVETADINFSVTGRVVGQMERTLSPISGTLQVNGGVVPTGNFSLEFVGEHVKSVRPGNSATYHFVVKSINNFSGLVALSTDIITDHKFAPGAIASATFDRASVTPTPEGNSVILSIGVSATALKEGPHTFAITGTATGTAGSIIHSLTNASLQIDNEAPEQPEITVNATVTMEGARGTEQPRFFFDLYPHDATARAARVFRKTDILPNEFTGDVVGIVVFDGRVTVGEQYTGYLRSTRHLWKKSTSNIDINATTTTYSMAFGSSTSPMLSGNVGPTPDASSFLDDDIINSLDFLTVFQEWAGIWLTRFADFDNNDVVNSADINFVLSHWGQRGDLLTNLPN